MIERPYIPALLLVWILCACSATNSGLHSEAHAHHAPSDDGLQTGYLEIVTKEVEATCAALEKVHGVTFGSAIQELGNARTATLYGGGQIGVRAPMHAAEKTVVRPYLLVADIEAAVASAKANGGMIAMPPTKLPEGSQFAIYFLGGIEHGLWQRSP